jgi:hypothetical protein
MIAGGNSQAINGQALARPCTQCERGVVRSTTSRKCVVPDVEANRARPVLVTRDPGPASVYHLLGA